mgnify:CR=1 FL=1
MNAKIKNQKEIIALVQKLRKEGKKIATYNGSFDILHLGHVKSLQEARKQGDVLIVPLNSDKSIKAYKSPKRPIIPQSQRAQMLAALSCVDYVVIFNETNPIKILDKIKPDIHCNGADYGKNCVEKDIVEKNGGKIHILKWIPNLSTSKIIKKILDVYSNGKK